MRFLNAAIVALAVLSTLGGYFQEEKRLTTILGLPPAAARDLYERAQVRRDRVLLVATALLVAGAVVALMLVKVRR
jgi:hypothetical protein